MKNFSVILNLILVIAVAILFYFHFSEKSEGNQVLNTLPLATGNIVYVNSDSLMEHYDYYKNKKTEFEDAQNKIKAQLKSEGEKLQKEIEEYQKKASTMTAQQRQTTEEQLSSKQQMFLQKKDELTGKLEDEQGKVNEEIFTRLGAYMKEFNKNRNYSFVLGYQKGGGILFANDSLNITKEIITGLNKEYEKEQKESK